MVHFLMPLNLVFKNTSQQRALWTHVRAGENYINNNELKHAVCQKHQLHQGRLESFSQTNIPHGQRCFGGNRNRRNNLLVESNVTGWSQRRFFFFLAKLKPSGGISLVHLFNYRTILRYLHFTISMLCFFILLLLHYIYLTARATGPVYNV